MINHALPDETMSDVRIVHDTIGVYADWFGPMPYSNERHNYLCGKTKPHYPVPITNDLALTISAANAGWFRTAVWLFY